MDKETYARQAPFAGKKKPSMQRRCVGHDYTSRRLYMLTMVVEGRRPLLGTLVGSTANEARVEPSELGLRVEREWWGIPRYHPEIEMVALQLMPDHLHGILFVREQMACDLSRVVRGFKTGCHRAIRELGLSPLVATQSQPTSKSHPKHGLLFAPGYNDRILRRYGQLDTWRAYLRVNPRRHFVRR